MNIPDPFNTGLPQGTLWALAGAIGLLAAALVYWIGNPIFDALRHFLGHFLPQRVPKPEGEFDLGLSSSRRTSVRRRGNEISVLIRTPGVAECWPGRVIDRSRTGLCIRVAREIPKGATIEVRTGEPNPWITVVVRRSADKGEEWELGCQFPAQLDDHLIAQFG